MGRFEPGFARLRVVALLALAGLGLPPAGRTADLPAAQLADELEALLRVPAVAGREAPAAAFIRGRLATPTESRGPAPGGTAAGSRPAGRPAGDSPAAAEDALGNVISSVGSGAPRKLIACALGEPGFAVSRIEDDGYLRLVPVGGAIPAGALWEQAHEGQTVMVAGARGDVPGAVAVRSVHLQQGQVEESDRPFSAADAFVDVGAENPAEVAALGIRLLDPVALVRRPVRLAGGLIAGPWARQKAACLALVAAARRGRARGPRSRAPPPAAIAGRLHRRQHRWRPFPGPRRRHAAHLLAWPLLPLPGRGRRPPRPRNTRRSHRRPDHRRRARSLRTHG